MSALDMTIALSAAAFLFYGLACLLSPRLVAEFERYRLARFRALVGSLEVAGALGLIVGWWFPPLQTAAAAGLAALMLCGLWARWRIRDPWYAMLPAFILGVINLLLALRTAAGWAGF
ncbi:MAG: DoxX family protein [Chthoniobacterales bacterium]